MALTTELSQMQSLLTIIGKEMLAGVGDGELLFIGDSKVSSADREHQAVQNMLVEFKVNIQ